MAEDIVKKQGTAVGQALDFSADAGAGFENADKEAYAIPFLQILQSTSPQCKKADGKYIKGAEEGMLYNSVTEKVFDGENGITVVPCHYDRVFLEFGDRNKGDTGFYGSFQPTSDRVLSTPPAIDGDNKGKQVTPEGHILTDMREHYVMVVNDDGSYSPAVIGMSSTQIKASRAWMSKMDGIKLPRADGSMYTPPMFSHMYRLTSIPQSNDQGSWMGWKVELIGQVERGDVYAAAKGFRDAIRAGEAKANVEKEIPF